MVGHGGQDGNGEHYGHDQQAGNVGYGGFDENGGHGRHILLCSPDHNVLKSRVIKENSYKRHFELPYPALNGKGETSIILHMLI